MVRHSITPEASRMGRAALSRKSENLHSSIYNALRQIAREEEIAPTLKGIAEQLNRRGLRTNRGNLFDFRKVGAALIQLGLDRVSLERWKQRARDRAFEWGVAYHLLYRQLWFEWQRHVVISDEPFVPHFVHPHSWVPPWERDVAPDWRFIHPPPQARLVALFLGPLFWNEMD